MYLLYEGKVETQLKGILIIIDEYIILLIDIIHRQLLLFIL